MTKMILTLAAAAAVFAVQAHAMVEDTDGNGSYSYEEMAQAYESMTDELFAEIDTDEDGEISEDELTAAIEAALIAG